MTSETSTTERPTGTLTYTVPVTVTVDLSTQDDEFLTADQAKRAAFAGNFVDYLLDLGKGEVRFGPAAPQIVVAHDRVEVAA